MKTQIIPIMSFFFIQDGHKENIQMVLMLMIGIANMFGPNHMEILAQQWVQELTYITCVQQMPALTVQEVIWTLIMGGLNIRKQMETIMTRIHGSQEIA